MFGDRMFGPAYFGNRYWGPAADTGGGGGGGGDRLETRYVAHARFILRLLLIGVGLNG
jgi:hypothetical protein